MRLNYGWDDCLMFSLVSKSFLVCVYGKHFSFLSVSIHPPTSLGSILLSVSLYSSVVVTFSGSTEVFDPVIPPGFSLSFQFLQPHNLRTYCRQMAPSSTFGGVPNCKGNLFLRQQNYTWVRGHIVIWNCLAAAHICQILFGFCVSVYESSLCSNLMEPW